MKSALFPGSWKCGRRAAVGRVQGLCCAALDYFWNMFPGISGYPGNIGNMFFLYFGFFSKKTRAEISRKMHRSMGRDLSYETDSGPKTKTVSDPNFQVTAATAAATSQQLSHLARALDHHAQGPNIPFGVIPHFDELSQFLGQRVGQRGKRGSPSALFAL